MSDLERQEISTSIDNVEVEDAMARQGDTNEMELDVIDPLDWTTDHVVAFLCHSPSTWSADPSLRPDPVLFKDVLRENLVSGKVLLNYVGKVLLNDPDKEILGLRALGHRLKLLDVIQHLQQRSVKYQTANSVKTAITQGKLLSFIPYSKH